MTETKLESRTAVPYILMRKSGAAGDPDTGPGAQTLTTTVWKKITFDSTISSRIITYATGIFTCNQGGIYMLTCDYTMQANAAGIRIVAFTVGDLADEGGSGLPGSTDYFYGSIQTNAPTTSIHRGATTAIVLANATDKIRFWMYQSSGGNLGIPSSNSNAEHFEIGISYLSAV